MSRTEREQPPRLRTWWTVECGRPTSTAIVLGLQSVRRRNSQIHVSSSAGTLPGERCGRLERSCKHANDSRSSQLAARQRATHSQTVDFETGGPGGGGERLAMINNATNDQHPTTRGETSSMVRHSGLLEDVSFDTHSLSAGLDLPTHRSQRPWARQLAGTLRRTSGPSEERRPLIIT
jgi:hypothetical protein